MATMAADQTERQVGWDWRSAIVWFMTIGLVVVALAMAAHPA